MKSLGMGSFGTVNLVQETSTRGLLALKAVDTKNTAGTEAELTIHGMLVHKNIVRLYDYYEDEDKTCMMLEYCKGGSLEEKLACLEDGSFFPVDALEYCQ